MDQTNSSVGNVIHQQHVSRKTSRPKIAIGPNANAPTSEIRLKKNGDTIESIEVQCACGETITIRCEYE